jgi:hypothetical protein
MDDQSGCPSLADLGSEIGRRLPLVKTIFDGTKLPLVEKLPETTTGGMSCTILLRDPVLSLRAPYIFGAVGYKIRGSLARRFARTIHRCRQSC